jgi:protein O-mannosyl-transferase
VRSVIRLLPFLVFVVTVACFAPALGNGFVAWDDDVNLMHNPRYRGLSPSHLRWMFTSTRGGHYDPLTWLTYAIDHTLWGMDPRGYHLTSILLHAANAVLVLGLAVALLRYAGVRDGGRLRLCAAAGALFFALHPLRVESVVWASERRDVLCGLFYLLTVLVYLRRPGSPAWLLVSFVCFVLSLLSKPWGMTLPGVLLVLDVYPLRRLRRPADAPRLLLEKLPYLGAAVAAAVVADRALAAAGALRPSLAQYGVGQRLAQAAYAACFYVAKTVLPLGLSPLHPVDLRLAPRSPTYLACGAIVLAAVALLIALRRRAPWALAAALCYGIVIFPVLGFAQAGAQVVADRYSYLACLPFAVLLAAALHAATAIPARRRTTTVATVALLATLGVLTVRQTRVWKDSLSLWNHAVRVDPTNGAAYVQRGWAKSLGGDTFGAIADYDTALRLDPDDALAYRNRGLARFRLHHLDGALADYSAAIRAKPDYATAYFERGLAWQTRGNDVAALADYDEAIRLNPLDARFFNNRGLVRAKGRELAGAIEDYSEAVRLDPDFPLAYLNRARARRLAEDRSGAIADVETAIRHAPAGSPNCVAAEKLLGELGVPEANRPSCAAGAAG